MDGYTGRIVKMGNSYGVIVPKALREYLGLTPGSTVKVRIEESMPTRAGDTPKNAEIEIQSQDVRINPFLRGLWDFQASV